MRDLQWCSCIISGMLCRLWAANAAQGVAQVHYVWYAQQDVHVHWHLLSHGEVRSVHAAAAAVCCPAGAL